MNLTILDENGAQILAASGEVDMQSAPALRTALLAAAGKGPSRIIVDLTEVGFMDSSGIAVLVEGLKESQKKKIPFVICGLTPKVKDVFELARLDKVFNLQVTRQDALAWKP